MRKLWLLSGAAAAAILAYQVCGTSSVLAQSGNRSGGARQGRGAAQTQLASRTFEQRFWDYLQNAQYRNWGPYPGQTDDFYPGQSPHGAFLKMYLNRAAAGNPETMPHGSVLVKENFSNQQQLMAITVMYRANGFDPEHNDWYYVKFNPDGSVATTPPDKGSKPIAGRFQSCIDCHSGATGEDFVFANDE